MECFWKGPEGGGEVFVMMIVVIDVVVGSDRCFACRFWAVGPASVCSQTNSLICHAWTIYLLPEDDRVNQTGVPEDFRSVLAALVF